MMNKLTANELKTKGVSVLDKILKDDHEATITVRGHNKYVVMDMERYSELRIQDLKAAYNDTMEDIKNGDYIEESVADHIKRLDEDI
ncbi:MAG: prevent-host-death protein [Candidatus Marinimicrobia bacterium]|jgi:PHD/YefM family antitoxin component YafN of YafNO toxin-antitoxin module|nr:prevent-host-death protein [Candidatus Neomarinimicrobiota bacterium]MBT4154584.1 prevent-host-death protein [Candidatus Neomarinimicrobiota bacterium]MBT4555311.1 prevent-host-death protein [Candidatus Neomarinimicrobiota bacterium]MBT5115950.1 prevent-host-death protein [Candidatus Neomarinimicrobiota bacterium]MBT5749112.1 prevent-host-death protein [Candidatus Neomarinimicrobiota bacterium]